MMEAPEGEDSYSLLMSCREFMTLLHKGTWESCLEFRAGLLEGMRAAKKGLLSMEMVLENGVKELIDISPKHIRWLKICRSSMCPPSLNMHGELEINSSMSTPASCIETLLATNFFAEAKK